MDVRPCWAVRDDHLLWLQEAGVTVGSVSGFCRWHTRVTLGTGAG
jgi:hypothetical protein